MKLKVYFHLGLNTKVSSKFLKAGECSIAQDCYFDEYGSIFSRKFKTTHLSFDEKICSIFPYNNSLFVNANGELYENTTLIGSGYGSTPFNHQEYNGVLYAVNQLKQIRYDGVDIYNIGNSKPTAKPIVSEGAAGNLDGTYYYKYTYEDQYGNESSASVVSNAITVTDKIISIFVTASPSDKVTWINIYRIGGTLTDYYYVGRVLNSTVGSSSSLGYIDIDDQGGNARKVWCDDNFIYVTNDTRGMEVYSVDGAGALSHIDNDDQGGNYYDVFGYGNFIYVAAGGLGVLSYSVDADGNLNFIDRNDQGGSARAVYHNGSFLFVANYESGILSYSVDGSGNMTFIHNLSQSANCIGIHGDSNWIYASFDDANIRSYSVDGSGNMSREDNVTPLPTPESAYDIFSDGNYVYVAYSYSGDTYIRVWSMTEGGNFSFVDSYTGASGTAYGLWSDGNYLYVADEDQGIRVFSISESGEITLLDTDNTQAIDAYGVHGDGTFLYVAGFASGLATYKFGDSFADNLADSSLSVLFDADNNDPPPSNLHYLVEHYERLIGARTTNYPNSILYATAYEPEHWGAALSQQYLLGDTDECSGLISWGRYVVFFKNKNIYIMEGTDPTLWYRRRSDASKGNIAPQCLAFWKFPIFCSYDGLYFFNGNLEQKFTDKIDPFFKRSDLEDAVGYVFNNKYYFGLSDITLVYDLINDIFYTYNFGITAMMKDSGIFYTGVSNNIVKMEQDSNINEESINFQIKSGAIKLNDGNTGYLKDYTLEIDTNSEDVTMNVYVDEKLKQSIVINTPSMQTVYRNFNAHLKGIYAEFEFVYTGTKQLQIDPPLCLNKLDN